MESLPLWLPVLFFVIAAFYASVGFGGGSSYLAILALIGLSYTVIPQTALVCNLVVSAGGVWHFHRAGHLDWRRMAPFVVLSVPLAYLGGRIPVSRDVFFALLGASLLVAGLRMFLPMRREGIWSGISERTAWLIGLPVGAALGFLAGLVGIGGGIFLAPVLVLTGWMDARRAAATAAAFIFVNSAAGLAGQLGKGLHLDLMVLPLVVAVLIGGQLGSRMGAYRIPVGGVRRLLAGLIVVVSVRILWGLV